MKTKEYSLRLISSTKDPIATLFACWAQSRPTQYPHLFEYLEENDYDSVVTQELVRLAILDGVVSHDEIVEAFKKIIGMPLPIQESVHFTWGFTSLPIEWREQAVRKRQWGFWLTSMREFGMDDFAREGRWALPAVGAVPTNGGHEYLAKFIEAAETAYNTLKDEYGWPQEIARKVIPLCATHNGTMFSNMRTLLETLNARSRWIAQIDLWGPVITSMLKDLGTIDPLLGQVVSPPCFNRFENDYKGCKYKMINENRLGNKDPYAPCPLYCMNEARIAQEYPNEIRDADGVEDIWLSLMKNNTEDSYIRQGQRLLSIWTDIWHRNPFSGKLL